jgi:ELWxxDGT repeat protein
VDDSHPGNFTSVNGMLFFGADDGDTHGFNLWKSDGTAVGTVMVKDINESNASSVYDLTDVNGTLYFVGDDDINGKRLWKSDGTTAGTVMVR